MQINMTPELQQALLQRIQLEYTQTAMANFALDIVGESLMKENADLKKQVEDLKKQIEETETAVPVKNGPSR
jgi:hypothetical protein